MSILLKQTPGKNIQLNRAGIFIRVSKLTPCNDIAAVVTLSYLHPDLKHI